MLEPTIFVIYWWGINGVRCTDHPFL